MAGGICEDFDVAGWLVCEAVLAAQGRGAVKHGQAVAWLKTAHDLFHAHTNHIAKRAAEAAALPARDDSVATPSAGKAIPSPLIAFGPREAPGKPNWRPLADDRHLDG